MSRLLLLTTAVAALTACAPAQLPPQPWDTPSLLVYSGLGPYQIEVEETLVLQHTVLNKPLNVRLSFPRAEGAYPVVVFSHGAYSSKDMYNPILDHWATHGFVVLAATHIDSTALGVERGDPGCRSQVAHPGGGSDLSVGQHGGDRAAGAQAGGQA